MIIIGTGLIAGGAARKDHVSQVLRDWFPLFVDPRRLQRAPRNEAGQWFTIHYTPQIHVDKAAVRRTVPTVWLQHAIFTPGQPHIWDYAAFFVYLSHFFVALIVAAVLWKVAHDKFHRFAVLFVSLSFAAFATYALFPAAPPWLASQTHALAPTAKIVDEIWSHLGPAERGQPVLGAQQPRQPGRGGPVAARRVPGPAHAVLLAVGGEVALAAAALPARDGVLPRLHGRALRVRHPAWAGSTPSSCTSPATGRWTGRAPAAARRAAADASPGAGRRAARRGGAQQSRLSSTPGARTVRQTVPCSSSSAVTPQRADERRALEPRAVEPGAAQVGAVEVGVLEVGVAQVGAGQVRVVELRPGEDGPGELPRRADRRGRGPRRRGRPRELRALHVGARAHRPRGDATAPGGRDRRAGAEQRGPDDEPEDGATGPPADHPRAARAARRGRVSARRGTGVTGHAR